MRPAGRMHMVVIRAQRAAITCVHHARAHMTLSAPRPTSVVNRPANATRRYPGDANFDGAQITFSDPAWEDNVTVLIDGAPSPVTLCDCATVTAQPAPMGMGCDAPPLAAEAEAAAVGVEEEVGEEPDGTTPAGRGKGAVEAGE